MATDNTTPFDRVRDSRLAALRSTATTLLDQWPLHLGLVLSLFLIGVPLVFVVVMSTQSASEILNIADVSFGTRAVENYRTVLFEYGFATYLVNTAIVAFAIAIGKVSISVLAVLAIVYYDFPFERLVFFGILFTLMLPVPVRIVPLYEVMIRLGWDNTLLSLVVPALASPTAVLILRQKFRSVPMSLVESAKLDGVGPLTFLVRVLLPMSRGMIVGLFGVAFIWGWNQYLWPLIVISSQNKQVVQVGLSSLKGTVAAGRPLWGLIMAGTMLALLPPLFVILALHKPLLNTFNYQVE